MLNKALVLMVLATSLLGFAGKASAAAAQPPTTKADNTAPSRKPLSDRRRANIAIKTVNRALEPWLLRNVTPIVRAAVVSPIGSESRNPITGRGPIQVFVRQELPATATQFQRWKYQFNKFSNRKFTVEVDPQGRAEILGDPNKAPGESLAPQYRAGRWFSTHIPIGTLTSDIVHAPNFGSNVAKLFGAGIALVVGHGAAPLTAGLSIAGAGALVTWAVKDVTHALDTQKAVRNDAFSAAVKWTNAPAQKADPPTVMQIFNYYQQKIQDDPRAPNTRPLSVFDFSQQLSVAGI
jgi:hypothetical protein